MRGILTRSRIRLGSYATLALALVAYLIVVSLLQENGVSAPWATEILFPVILFTTLASAAESRDSVSLIVLAVVVPILGRLSAGSNTAWLLVATDGVRVLFLLLVTGVILRHVFRDAAVTPDMILGAVCAYLLIGLAFNQLYSLVETLPARLLRRRGRRAGRRSYFSLVTLSTLGYGDVVPSRALARSLAAVEAVLGQFYIAVIVARLVAIRMAYAPAAVPASADADVRDAPPRTA